MRLFLPIFLCLFTAQSAFAANFESSLRSLVNAFIGKILPIFALFYLGKNIFEHIQNDPDAKRRSVQLSVAIIALIGINGVWSWLTTHAR